MILGAYSESDIQTEDGEIGGLVPGATDNRVCAGKAWGGRMLDGKACWAEKRRARVLWNEECEGDMGRACCMGCL